jgi:hypothetical protein
MTERTERVATRRFKDAQPVGGIDEKDAIPARRSAQARIVWRPTDNGIALLGKYSGAHELAVISELVGAAKRLPKETLAKLLGKQQEAAKEDPDAAYETCFSAPDELAIKRRSVGPQTNVLLLQLADSLHTGEAKAGGAEYGFTYTARLTSALKKPDLTSRFEVSDTEEVKQETQDIPLLSESEMPPAPDDDGRRSKVVRRINGAELPAAFARIDSNLKKLHDPVIARFQRLLDALHQRSGEGESCPTLDQNRDLAARILSLADKYGVKLFHSHNGTLQQVRFRCVNVLGHVAGEFRVETADRSKTRVTSGPTFPRLIAGRL